MVRWVLIAMLLVSFHREVTEGQSVMGCFLRGLYRIETGTCGEATP